jgi:hypothetical protein
MKGDLKVREFIGLTSLVLEICCADYRSIVIGRCASLEIKKNNMFFLISILIDFS